MRATSRSQPEPLIPRRNILSLFLFVHVVFHVVLFVILSLLKKKKKELRN